MNQLQDGPRLTAQRQRIAGAFGPFAPVGPVGPLSPVSPLAPITTVAQQTPTQRQPAVASAPASPVAQRYAVRENGVNLSEQRQFAVVGEGRGNTMFVAPEVDLPKFQHVELHRDGRQLDIDGVQLEGLTAEFENESELAAMFCGKFSRVVTGIEEKEENELAGPGRSLYVDKLYDLEGAYDGAWVNHFAPVVVADGTDRGTLETAVGIDFIWHGIYGKQRGQSFRYKTAVADVALQLSRKKLAPEQAQEVLDFLQRHAVDNIPAEENVSPQLLDEVVQIEKALQSMAVVTPQTWSKTELEGPRKEREQREAVELQRRISALMDDVRNDAEGWRDRVPRAHEHSMRTALNQALLDTGLQQEQRLRFEDALALLPAKTGMGSASSGGNAPQGSGFSALHWLGGAAFVVAALLFVRWHRS